MTIPPEDREPGDETATRPPIRIVTAAHTEPSRVHVASEEEREDDRRRAALAAHVARRPVATLALMGAITAMFAAQYALGGVDDPFVMIRLGALVPSDVRAGAVWRLVSSAFLHAGVVHYGLNTYVLWVVGRNLERVIGSARFLVAFALSVVGASLASLAFSDARLTVGASGGVFGLFGVEAVVVLLRPDLLPTDVRQTHARNVLMNLVINVVASFRPHVAMAAHFGGGLVGAALGLLLVPTRLPPQPRTARWEMVGAALATALLLAGAGLGLRHALLEGTRAPTLVRRSIGGLDGVERASAEIPDTLEESDSLPSTFGDLERDEAMVSFQIAVVDGAGLAESERAMREGEPVEDLQHVGGREISAAGRRGYLATYTSTQAPLTLDRVVVWSDGPEPGLTTGWVVELAYWTSTAEAYEGVAERIAGSIDWTLATE